MPTPTPLTLSSNDLADPDAGALSHTLKQIYANATGNGYAMYNDETPSGSTTSSRAHSKGVVAFGGDGGGFLLVHSSPKFPDFVANGYAGFGKGTNTCATTYGQSFLCLSLDAANIELVATNMAINWPKVYDYVVPAALAGTLPKTAAWLNDGAHTKVPTAVATKLTTTGGVAFTAFAKNREWAKDLYEDLVAKELGTGLAVESWQDGSGGKLASFCTSGGYAYDVENVEEVTIQGGSAGGENPWKKTHDHSKWAVALDGSVACIGDINRMASQEKRGGGTVCGGGAFAAQMKATATSIETCSKAGGGSTATTAIK
jgi:deoxyribonuclease-2